LPELFCSTPDGLGKLLLNWAVWFKPVNNTGDAYPKKHSLFLAMFALPSVKLKPSLSHSMCVNLSANALGKP
jgi:hypothetical protein